MVVYVCTAKLYVRDYKVLYICTYVCILTYTFLYILYAVKKMYIIYKFMYVSKYLNKNVCMYVCICLYVHAYVGMYVCIECDLVDMKHTS